MSTSLSKESKNTAALTNESKPQPTWDESTGTWDDAPGTWDNAGIPITPETKNTVSLSKESRP